MADINDIIAQGAPPPQVDPNAIANRIITLRQAYQQQQMGREQLTAARQENEQRQIQMDQTRAINQAYSAALTTDADGNPTIDRAQLTQGLMRNGHGSAIPAIMKQLDETELAHNSLLEAKGKVAIQEKEYAASIGAAVKAANGDPELLMTLGTNAVRQGHVDDHIMGPMLQKLQQAKAQDLQTGGKTAQQVASQMAETMIGLSPTVTDAQAKLTEAGARQKTAGIEADKAQLAKDNQFLQQAAGAQSQQQLDQLRQQGKALGVSDAALGRLPSMFSPDGMEAFSRSTMNSKERADVDNQKTTRTEVNRHDLADEAAATTRNNIAGGELALGQKRFDATLGAGLDANGQPLSPDALKAAALKDPVAVAISEYLAPDASTKSALGQATMRKVYAIDGQHDGTQFGARNKTAVDYSPAGQTGKTFNSIDNALAHIDMLSQAGKALDNNNLPDLNRIANALGVHLGGSAKQIYDGIVQVVGPEIIKGTLGEAGGEGERGKMAQTLTSDANTASREGTLGAIAEIYGKRVSRMREGYKQQMNKDWNRQLSQDSQTVLQRYTGGGQQGAQLPNGGGKVLDDDSAKVFLKAAGGDVTKARQMATQNNWKLQ